MSPEQRELLTKRIWLILMKRSRATYLLLRGDEQTEARKYLWDHAREMVGRLGVKRSRAFVWEWGVGPGEAQPRDASGRWT